MKKYDSYKDSGIEWIGEIPSHWGVVRFKHHFDFINEKCDLDLPKLGLEHIESWTGRILENDTEFKGEGICFQNGDILFGKLRPYLAKVFLADFMGKAVGDFFVFRPTPDLSPAFAHKLLLSRNFIEITNSSTFGSKMPRVSPDFISELKIIVPPIPEQTSIASYLDRKTFEIDELIAGKERLLELYEDEKTAIINQAVTGKLKIGNGEWKMKDSGIEWLGEIPEHWEVKRLSWCFEIIGSGTTPKAGSDEYYLNGEFNWLLTGDLTDGEIWETSKKITQQALDDHTSLKEYPENSIVMAMYGATIGKLGILKISTTVNQACCVLGKPIHFYHLFAFYILLAARQDIINMSYGGGQPNISQELIKSFRVPVPPIEEQQSIVNHIEAESGRIDGKIERTQKLIALLKEYRKTLISEVVTGKVKVIEN